MRRILALRTPAISLADLLFVTLSSSTNGKEGVTLHRQRQ